MCHKRARRVTRALKAKAACNGYLGYGYFLCTLPKCVAELKTSTVSMGKSLSHLKRPKYLELVLVKDSFKLPGFSVEATGKSDIRGFAFCTNLISRPWHSPDTLRSCGFQEATRARVARQAARGRCGSRLPALTQMWKPGAATAPPTRG